LPNRILKESICYSEDINKLKPDEEIFFYRLIVNCDDYGRLDARIPILKSRLYPLREQMKSDDIKRYLKKLIDVKPEPLIILYENGGIQYLQMCKWEKHQQIRAKRSKYPSLTDKESIVISNDINGNQMIAYVPENPNPNPNPIRESESESKTAIEIAIDDFKEFRKKIKKPMTDKAVELFKKELNKLSKDEEVQTAIINQSIVNGWQGVFPLKQPLVQQPTQMTASERKDAELQAALKKVHESGGESI
jgi:hypothetical protein